MANPSLLSACGSPAFDFDFDFLSSLINVSALRRARVFSSSAEVRLKASTMGEGVKVVPGAPFGHTMMVG